MINRNDKKTDIKLLTENYKEFMKNNKVKLKSQQRLKSERHNVVTEEINKIALSSNNDNRIQSVDSTETYTYGTKKSLIRKK